MRVLILHQIADPSRPDELDVLAQVRAVSAALESLGHAVSAAAVGLDLLSLKRTVSDSAPDVVWNLVESLDGRDSLISLVPRALESWGVRYTGCSAAAMELSNHKPRAKRRMRDVVPELLTPNWWEIGSPLDGRVRPGSRWIIKPTEQHGSLGLTDDAVVTVGAGGDAELLGRLLAQSEKLGMSCFAEAFVDGREFNISLLVGDGPGAVRVLPPAEIDFAAFPADKPRIVGFDAKWTEGSFAWANTPRAFPDLSGEPTLLAELEGVSRACWELFGLAGWARVDCRVDAAGRVWVLEVNANPCLSPDAGFAAAAARAGLSLRDVVEAVLQWPSAPVHRGLTPSRPDFRKLTPVGSPTPPTPKDQQPTTSAPLVFHDRASAEFRQPIRAMIADSGLFTPSECDIAVELLDERLARGPASGYEFVFAEQAGQLVGYACYGLIGCTDASYDLYWIAVVGRRHRQGLGAALLAETERRVAALGGARLYVETSSRPDYLGTRRFYLRQGYAVVSELPNFYRVGDGRVVFFKEAGIRGEISEPGTADARVEVREHSGSEGRGG